MDVRDSLGVSPILGPMDFLRGGARDRLGAAAGAPQAPASAAPTSAAPTSAAPTSTDPNAPGAGTAAPIHQAKPMSQREIDHVAEGFDALFASLLIKQMRQTLDQEGEGGMFGKDSGDVMGGMFDTFMGDHLAKAGGFGIGRMVKHQLEQTAMRRKPYAAQAAVTRAERASAESGAAFPTAANPNPTPRQ